MAENEICLTRPCILVCTCRVMPDLTLHVFVYMIHCNGRAMPDLKLKALRAVRRAGFFIIVKMYVCCVVAFFCFMMFLRARKSLSVGALFRNLGALWYHFWVNFRSLEAFWERWGPTLNVKKWIGHPKVPHEAKPRKSPHFMNTNWESFFEHFSICWGMFLGMVFC